MNLLKKTFTTSLAYAGVSTRRIPAALTSHSLRLITIILPLSLIVLPRVAAVLRYFLFFPQLYLLGQVYPPQVVEGGGTLAGENTDDDASAVAESLDFISSEVGLASLHGQLSCVVYRGLLLCVT